jgi:hypothetical protein
MLGSASYVNSFNLWRIVLSNKLFCILAADVASRVLVFHKVRTNKDHSMPFCIVTELLFEVKVATKFDWLLANHIEIPSFCFKISFSTKGCKILSRVRIFFETSTKATRVTVPMVKSTQVTPSCASVRDGRTLKFYFKVIVGVRRVRSSLSSTSSTIFWLCSGTGTLLPVSVTINAKWCLYSFEHSFLLCPRLLCLLMVHFFFELFKWQLFSHLAGRRS